MGSIIFPIAFVDGSSAELADTSAASLVVFEVTFVYVAILQDYLAGSVSLLPGAVSNVLTRELLFDFCQFKKAILDES